jgi:hypothetical protein
MTWISIAAPSGMKQFVFHGIEVMLNIFMLASQTYHAKLLLIFE